MNTNQQFTDYVLSFYGPDGIYPMQATQEQVEQATTQLIASGADFAGDSIDREKVRDLLIQNFNLKFPNPNEIRLQYLRQELRKERISYGELAELQDFAAKGVIDPSDYELLEAAGIPEEHAKNDYRNYLKAGK